MFDESKVCNELFEIASEYLDKEELEKSFSILYASAKIGDASAQMNLGYYYEQGIGIKKEVESALYWYKKAFKNGEYIAASNLAILYEEIDNFRQARYWFYKSIAKEGDELYEDGDAFYEVGLRYFKGLGCFPKNLSKSIYFLKKAIKSTNITEDSLTKAINIIGIIEEKRTLLACRNITRK